MSFADVCLMPCAEWPLYSWMGSSQRYRGFHIEDAKRILMMMMMMMMNQL